MSCADLSPRRIGLLFSKRAACWKVIRRRFKWPPSRKVRPSLLSSYLFVSLLYTHTVILLVFCSNGGKKRSGVANVCLAQHSFDKSTHTLGRSVGRTNVIIRGSRQNTTVWCAAELEIASPVKVCRRVQQDTSTFCFQVVPGTATVLKTGLVVRTALLFVARWGDCKLARRDWWKVFSRCVCIHRCKSSSREMLQPSRPAETFKLKSLLAPLTTYQPSPQLSLSPILRSSSQKTGPFYCPSLFSGFNKKPFLYIFFSSYKIFCRHSSGESVLFAVRHPRRLERNSSTHTHIARHFIIYLKNSRGMESKGSRRTHLNSLMAGPFDEMEEEKRKKRKFHPPAEFGYALTAPAARATATWQLQIRDKYFFFLKEGKTSIQEKQNRKSETKRKMIAI